MNQKNDESLRLHFTPALMIFMQTCNQLFLSADKNELQTQQIMETIATFLCTLCETFMEEVGIRLANPRIDIHLFAQQLIYHLSKTVNKAARTVANRNAIPPTPALESNYADLAKEVSRQHPGSLH